MKGQQTDTRKMNDAWLHPTVYCVPSSWWGLTEEALNKYTKNITIKK